MTWQLPDAEATRDLGRALAAHLRAGDLLVLTGELGAGKTTLTQGIGEGLGVRGQVASPTFIIARSHRSLGGGPDLVHVDAYRLGSLAELDALDLDSSLEDSVTVVEWGHGLAEALAEDRLEIVIDRPRGGLGLPPDDATDGAPDIAPDDRAEVADEGARTVRIVGHGERWADIDLDALGTRP